jgi:hypothetical protein
LKDRKPGRMSEISENFTEDKKSKNKGNFANFLAKLNETTVGLA